VAHLRRQADGHWSMVWTNAGHPPPIVVGADGTTVQLDAHDTMFGHGLGAWPRVDHHLELEPGSTLFLYTDGLIERRGTRIDEALVELRAHLSRRRHLPVEDLVDDVVAFPDLTARDDVVVFAVRLPGTPAG
jgi:serine phosphatase RsbU (regulator of sigma subunit)